MRRSRHTKASPATRGPRAVERRAGWLPACERIRGVVARRGDGRGHLRVAASRGRCHPPLTSMRSAALACALSFLAGCALEDGHLPTEPEEPHPAVRDAVRSWGLDDMALLRCAGRPIGRAEVVQGELRQRFAKCDLGAALSRRKQIQLISRIEALAAKGSCWARRRGTCSRERARTWRGDGTPSRHRSLPTG